MSTITVIYNSVEFSGRKVFPKTLQGQRDSIKFIQQLYDKRRKDVWFFDKGKIKKIDDLLSDKTVRLSTNRRYKLESELLQLKKQRDELFAICGVPEIPDTIKVEIMQE